MWNAKAIVTSLLLGSVIGAVLRPLVVYIMWYSQQGTSQGAPFVEAQKVLVYSIFIGLWVGLLAGAIAGMMPVRFLGSVIGGLSGASVAMFSAAGTYFFLCCMTARENPGLPEFQEVDPWIYFGFMGLTGAIPGVVGGLAADLIRSRDRSNQPTIVDPNDPYDDPRFDPYEQDRD